MNTLEIITYYCKTITGKNRGAGLGFPTINLIPPKKFPYKPGIYAGWLFIGETRLMAAIHYGPIPVFKDKNSSLEVHGINAQVGQRPEKVAIQMIAKIRDVSDFKNVVALKTQIKKDVKKIQSILDSIE